MTTILSLILFIASSFVSFNEEVIQLRCYDRQLTIGENKKSLKLDLAIVNPTADSVLITGIYSNNSPSYSDDLGCGLEFLFYQNQVLITPEITLNSTTNQLKQRLNVMKIKIIN